MSRLISLMLVALGLSACVALPPTQTQYAPQLREERFAATPDVVYPKAYAIFQQHPGWTAVSAEPTMRSFRGVVNGAADVAVLVEPDGQGSRVSIKGEVTRRATGEFTEVDEYVRLLREALR